MDRTNIVFINDGTAWPEDEYDEFPILLETPNGDCTWIGWIPTGGTYVPNTDATYRNQIANEFGTWVVEVF